MSKPNGKDQKKDKIVKFPSLAERDRIRKKQEAQENEWRKSYKQRASNDQPFFNFGKIPPFTKTLAPVLIAIHVLMAFLYNDIERFAMINEWGFVPEHFSGGSAFEIMYLLTPITYALLHADWMHLGFNAFMLLALGTFAEKMFSTKTMINFTVICTLASAAIFFTLNPGTSQPLIGASGAISGLFAAALMMMYEMGRLGPLTGKFAGKGPWPVIMIWVAIMIIMAVISGGGIAWEAHVGGFVCGALLYHFMRKGKLRI